MKLCPQCRKASPNAAMVCDCGGELTSCDEVPRFRKQRRAAEGRPTEAKPETWAGCAVTVLVASFAPWARLPINDVPGKLTVMVTGWNGTVTLLGVEAPNWSAVLAALLLSALAVPSLRARIERPTLVRTVLVGFGVALTARAILLCIREPEATVGVGLLVTFAAYAAMAYALWRERAVRRAVASRRIDASTPAPTE